MRGIQVLVLAVVDPSFLVAADFGGDGIPDVAVTETAAARVSVLQGNGTGGFLAPVQVSVGQQPQGIAAADLDGDGDLELAVANALSDTVSRLLNDGSGAFGNTWPRPTSTATGGSIWP